MELFDKITENAVVHENQGYAFYFKYNDIIIEKVNGKVSTLDSDDISFNSCFRLASVSKQFIGCGIISLVEKGLLSFDTCILNIYEDLPNYFKNIKIINLLNHSSGIYDYEDMTHSDIQIHDEDILDFLKTTNTTYFEVGTKYRYSNTAYILLGLIIEKVSNTKLDIYLKEEVFLKEELPFAA